MYLALKHLVSRAYSLNNVASAHCGSQQQTEIRGATVLILIKKRFALPIILLCLIIAACDRNNNSSTLPLPTRANPEAVRTANAVTPPPPGFETIAFDPIDHNRDLLPSWYFEVTVNFEGQYTETGENAVGSLVMQVWEDGVNRSRRVTLSFLGDALSGGNTRVEAVRFENEFYILDSNGICTRNNEAAQQTASLTAEQLVGGVTLALPTGIADDINEYVGYQYAFAEENLSIDIFRNEPSTVDVVGGEVWVLPEYNVVGRFGVSMNVHAAQILFGERPVTGSLNYQYNLYDIGEAPNIALPNGC
jgi:hypothetical protein